MFYWNKFYKKMRMRSAFTLAELVAAMLVMTMIVAVTIPITRNKMQKADYSHYYLGYAAMKDISANAFPKVLATLNNSNGDEDDEDKCGFVIDNICFGKPFNPTFMTYAECAGENATTKETTTEAGTTAKALGISKCYYDDDYWAGAVKKCGGIKYMPTLEHLLSLAKYIYNGYPYKDVSWASNLTLDTEKILNLGFILKNDEYTAIWTNTEYSDRNAYVTTFGLTGLQTLANERWIKPPNYQAVCVLGEVDEEPEDSDNAKLFCEIIKDMYNIKNSKCEAPVANVQASAVSLDFSSLTPHITMSNGLKLYIGSDFTGITTLSDAVEEDDRTGFIIYIDVNGKSGKTKLYEDVFPFYLLKSGKVLAAYNPAVAAGGNNVDNLNCRVIYEDNSEGNHALKVLMRDATFQEAACATGMIQSATYCESNVQYEICKDMANDCRIRENKPWQMK